MSPLPILHAHPFSSYCWKVLIALYENETPFEPLLVDLADDSARAELVALWPIGKFPVLRDEAAGLTVPESTTILEYLARRGDDHLDVEAVVLRAKKEQAAAAPRAADGARSWEEQKRRKNRQKQLPGLRDAAMKAIEDAEARKAAIHARWCEPGYFEKTPAAEVAALEAEEKGLGPRIAALMSEWEALEKEIEETAG